jgi:pimeloyl-ACP methyl ester carboxylesterase
MDGKRHSVTGADGVSIGLLTAGHGPPLLLVHGGMGQLERWAPIWDTLASRWQVTAMDRRGRGSSGDGGTYALSQEFGDVAAVAAHLAAAHDGPADVFAHSYGATCALGAAGQGAPVRRLALYEPPGALTVPPDWVARATGFVRDGQPGRAMMSFLTEVIGLSREQVGALRDAPAAYDVLSVVAATLPREAHALASTDPAALAAGVKVPVLLLLGALSPPWAGDITRAVAAALPAADLVVLPGQGHEAIDASPALIAGELARFFGTGRD